jgi:hypothetical protein
MNILRSTKESIGTLLVDQCTTKWKWIFVTISPNPHVKIPCWMTSNNGKRVSCHRPYQELSHRNQYEYCLKIVNQCYLNYDNDDMEIYGTWELNKSKNVHFHFLMSSSTIKTNVALDIFRRDVSNCNQVLLNRAKRNSKRNLAPDYMNNIVFLNKPIVEVIAYCDKDYKDNIEQFDNYYFRRV